MKVKYAYLKLEIIVALWLSTSGQTSCEQTTLSPGSESSLQYADPAHCA